MRVFAVLFSGLLLLPLFTTASFAESHALTRTVTVSGEARVSGVPDKAQVTAGVVTRAETAAQALSANSAQMRKLFQVLNNFGIPETARRTTSFNVAPVYSRPPRNSANRNQPPKIVAYDVRNQVSIDVADFDKLGPILGALGANGANQINGIRFSIANPKPLQDKARQLAMRDAKAKAALYVTEAGAKLGKVLQISESVLRGPSPKVFRSAAALEASDAVPVARGSQDISARISVVFEIE